MANYYYSYFFWRTKKNLYLIFKYFKIIINSFYKDLIEIASLLKHSKKKNNPVINIKNVKKEIVYQQKPIIFVSSCENIKNNGGSRFNGGIKMLNLLCNLLIGHGYESYVVTYDGLYEPWLIKHAPHISLDQFKQIVLKNQNVKCITSWARADAFIKYSPNLYFWDMELAYTNSWQFCTISNLIKKKIVKIAGCNRMICAWYMSNFGINATFLPDWVDDDFWKPDKSMWKKENVGYMNEHHNANAEIDVIKRITALQGLSLNFVEIKGSEEECLKLFQTCNIFIGLNRGKDPIWGEGFGLPMFEAMKCGCIVVANNVVGNQEFIINGYNGLLLKAGDLEGMAQNIVNIIFNEIDAEEYRQKGEYLLSSLHTKKSRWFPVKEFLEL